MIERAIENWLTNTNERNYQTPFCQVLMCKGYRILYVSSHRPMEQGKDIVTQDANGGHFAYQLKTGDVDLKKWREIKGEIDELIQLPIVHPAIDKNTMHRSFLVLNGRITDEVRLQIDLINQDNINKGRRYSYLDVIDGPSLLNYFLEVQGKFMPQDVQDFASFLKLHLADGRDFLDKEAFFQFIDGAVLKVTASRKSDILHAITSSVIVSAYLLKPYQDMENHFAVFQAWVALAGCLVRYTHRVGLSFSEWSETLDLVISEAVRNLRLLKEEVLGRPNLLEGDPMGDGGLTYKARSTILVGALCALELHLRDMNEDYTIDSKSVDFVVAHISDLWLWGESALSNIVHAIHLFEAAAKTEEAKNLLSGLLKSIVTSNGRRSKDSLPFASVYYEVHEILDTLYGFLEEAVDFSNFAGSSYILWLVVQMMARRGMRKELEDHWREVTHIHMQEFRLDKIEDVFSWRTKLGENTGYFPDSTQSWSRLVEKATDASDVPDFVKTNKWLLRLFVLVCPHRLNIHTLCALECASI